MEKQLLNLVYTSRPAWEKIRGKVNEKDFSPHGWALYQEISKYYEHDPGCEKCDPDILTARLKRAYPKSPVFDQIIGGFHDTVSVPNVLQELYDFKRALVKQRLATKLLDEKAEDHEAIGTLWEEYNEYLIPDEGDSDKPEIRVGRSISDVVERLTDDSHTIQLYPGVLNDAVGRVPMQTHIIVFATPEVGKSAFCINQAVGTAQEGHKVLFFDNEDPEDQTWLRYQSRITGMSREEIYANPKKAQKILDDTDWYGNIHIVSYNPGTIRQIEEMVHDIQPTLLICNQIRNLFIPGVEGDVAQLTVAGRAMRSLIKRNNIVGISVTQAADSAARKSELDIGDVYMSNTSLPGDADIMIGVGGTKDMIEKGYRMLSLPKNKLTGDHEPRAAMLHKHISKFTSL